jgi:chemosensory pili system protein ChpA (sensor histidine kinase/response regulator)
MNPDNTVEYNSLSWVKAQLDDVLSDAQASLNEYIENKADGELENCIEHLQLITGTLQMVEVYGASMLAEEMKRTTEALLKGSVERDEDTYDVLMRAMLQLPDYLESIQAGKKDAPIALMPLINDLRAARKEGLLTESGLFSPDLESAELSTGDYDAAAIKPGKLQDETKRLRTHYQLGLLDFIRNKKERVGLQRIRAVLNALEKVSAYDEVRRIWMVVGALVEGLMKHGIDSNISIKMLLGAVDRQLKFILDNGEDEFSNQYSKELVKNVLYYVGLCTEDSKLITAVKEAYNLSDLIHQETDDSVAIGGLNADLFDTVSKGITEDLTKVKDVLELFMQSNEQDVKQLEPVVEQLGKIADTYGMLGMGATRQSIMDQRTVMESIVNGDTEISEQVVLGIASGLLNAELELKDYIDSRSGYVDMNTDKEDRVVPASEYRQVVYTVVAEGLKNFSEAKEAILSYISGIGDKEQLDIIINRLEEVRGVSMMLPLGRVESQIEKLQNFIRVVLLNNSHKVSDSEQDTVADVVTSIEYFFEALSEGRPGVEQGLNTGDEAASKLEEITESCSELEQEGAAENREKKIAAEPVELELVKTKPAETEQDKAKAVEAAQITEQQDATQYTILADDADEEIVEIFIEEALEVLGDLHEYTPQWKANNEDKEALAVVRRCFHTLKGSGRLLGAEMIGEFSWKFENMINRYIDKKITVSESFFHVLDEALAVLPQLIEQLKGNREPIDNIAHLMSSADALAEGHDILTESVDEGGGETAGSDAISEDKKIHLVSEVTIEADVDGVVDAVIEESSELESVDEKGEVDSIPGLDVSELEIESGRDENSISLQEITASPLEIVDDFVAETDLVEEIEIAEVAEEGGVIEEIVLSDAEEIIEDAIEAIELTVDDESITETIERVSADAADTDLREKDEDGSSEELTELADDAGNEFEIVIDENVVDVPEDVLDIDPILLKIYHDESQGYVETIRQLIDDSESGHKPLKVNKSLIRAFHTLYGSARTAEVGAIADLSGSAEKYIRVRQEGGEETIPDEVVSVFKEIDRAISGMLSLVEAGHLPVSNKALQDKILKIVQQEIQTQLQQSWQENTADNKDHITEASSSEDGGFSDVDEQNSGSDVGHADAIGDKLDDINATVTANEQSTEQIVEVSYGDIDDELIDIFLEEAEELLESCEQTLNEIENTPNSTEHIQQLQRNMHTLKGGARMADLAPVGDLTHNLESLVVMVSSNKVDADKTLFDLLQESLDALTNMLANVKNRQPLRQSNNLNDRIEMLMRGEVEEKRAVERFDIELTELESEGDEEPEEHEDIDIAELLPGSNDDNTAKKISLVADEVTQKKTEVKQQKKTEDKVKPSKDRPHWGQRATDVNFKDSQEQIRVRSDLLNNLVNYAGEVNIYHARMSKQITDFGFNLSELTQTVVRLKEQLRKLEIETEIQIRSGYEKESDNYDDDFDPLEMDQYSTLQQLTRSLSETAADVDSINEILTDITRDSETLLLQESRVSTDLQEGLMRTRMVRFGGLSSRLRRIVRQIARELGKEVDVEIIGESSEVDRTVLDRIIAPMEHILRNAVAHGIEKPEVRKAVGKDETGKIIIKVDRQGADVVICIKDDGSGINVSKVREKAIRQGLISADAKLSDHDALQFILQSGFSTADEVTQVSGRGVGMDVVDSEIKQLGGVLDIDTVQGKGVDFTVRLPLTLAINQALLVSAGEDVFAVPLASIEGVVRMNGYELQRFYDSDNSLYEFNGVEFELKHLGGMLTGYQPDYSKQLQLFPVLLVRVGDQHFALHVDDMLGRREIVVKPVGLQIGAVRGIAGATILADGRVVLILEMSALVASESLFKPHVPVEIVAEPVVDTRKTIMVVDDSITIRKITERMLKRYGIDVVLAKDGVDATTQLQEFIPDLMLLDIEMPRMDGFEVASFVRNDARLKDIPIIMITSRTGVKHKEKATKIGVNQYLGKPFQEDDLLSNINEILHTAF